MHQQAGELRLHGWLNHERMPVQVQRRVLPHRQQLHGVHDLLANRLRGFRLPGWRREQRPRLCTVAPTAAAAPTAATSFTTSFSTTTTALLTASLSTGHGPSSPTTHTSSTVATAVAPIAPLAALAATAAFAATTFAAATLATTTLASSTLAAATLAATTITTATVTTATLAAAALADYRKSRPHFSHNLNTLYQLHLHSNIIIRSGARLSDCTVGLQPRHNRRAAAGC